MSLPENICFQMMAFNEDEALKIILGTPVNETPIAARMCEEESATDHREFKSQTEKENGECFNVSEQNNDESQGQQVALITMNLL